MVRTRLLLALAALAALPALAQVTSVTVGKGHGYIQRSATDVRLDPAPNNFSFNADVDGVNIGGIPAPTISGPLDPALGPQLNGGRLAYSPGDGGWRFGPNANDSGWPSAAERDSHFGSGTYTFGVNGASVALRLVGDAYPNMPVLSLAGGAWSGGQYVVDASRALTIATNAFNDYGAHLDDSICLFVLGPGLPQPFQEVAPFGCNWGYGARRSHSSDATANFLTFTVPPNTLTAGQEYVVGALFAAAVDINVGALAGSTNLASYAVHTVASVKVVSNQPPPVFPLTVNSNINAQVASVSATFQPRAEDVGTNANVYVFAVAPLPIVKAGAAKAMRPGWVAPAWEATADGVPCVLAQLDPGGQLRGVSSASALQAALSGVLTSQGQSVTILNGVATPNVAGATFYVGYGASGGAMIDGGINRSAVTVPGSVVCQPQPPATGWWWNPLEDGRGFSIESRGPNLFFASFLYDVSGRSTWTVASGPASLDGSLFTADLLSARGGQTLGGAYPGRPSLAKEGTVTLAFDSDRSGTLVWPGGTVPIQRFDIVPNGLAAGPGPGVPESGWWWNESESGRGFFMEWQAGVLDIAGYMYDEAGNPLWYLTVGAMATPGGNTFTGSWWSYGNGQTLTGAWKPNTRLSTTVAPLTITFSGPDTALMTLPNGRTTALTRHRF